MPKMPARAAEVAARPAPERISLPTPRVALVIAAAVVVGDPPLPGARRADAVHRRAAADLPARSGRRLGRASARRLAAVPRGLAVLIVYASRSWSWCRPAASARAADQSAARLRPDFPRLISSVEASLAQLRVWYESLDLPPEVRSAIDQALANLTRAPARSTSARCSRSRARSWERPPASSAS